MNRYVKRTMLVVLIVMFSFQFANAQVGYTIDHVEGAFGNTVQPDIPLTMHLRLQNNGNDHVACITTGFRFYLSNNGELPDGEFQVIQYDESLVNWNLKFDLASTFNAFSFDGLGADTLGIGCIYLQWNDDRGFDPGFDSVILTFSTMVDASFAGDSLCIDSSYYPPSGTWLWTMRDPATGNYFDTPNWTGPHCYEILPSCCIGITGNYDNSPDHAINVGDIEVLIGFMFRMEPPPICMEEADISGDGMVDVADLVYFINYAFFQGPQPVDCP